MESKVTSKVYAAGEKTPDGFTIENTLNATEDALPFGLYNPETEGKLTWVCGEGTENKIVSVFCMDLGDHTERQEAILDDLEQARYMRKELIANGWKKLVTPTVNFTVTSGGRSADMNRRQKRSLARKMERFKDAPAK
jgi:hypothetical protein